MESASCYLGPAGDLVELPRRVIYTAGGVSSPKEGLYRQSARTLSPQRFHTLSIQKVRKSPHTVSPKIRKSPTLLWNSRIQIKFLTWVKKLIFKLLIYLCKAFYKRKHVGILIKQMLVMKKIDSLSKSQWRISQLPSLHGSRLGIRNTTWPSPILPPYKAQSCCFLPSKVMSSEFTS